MNTVWSNLHVLFSLVLVTLKFRYKERNSNHCLFRNCDSDLGSMTYFCSYLSSKRREEFKEFQDFAEVDLEALSDKMAFLAESCWQSPRSVSSASQLLHKPCRCRKARSSEENPRTTCQPTISTIPAIHPTSSEWIQQIVSGLLLNDTK